MSRWIHNWMRWWKRWSTTDRRSSLKRFVNYGDQFHPTLSLAKEGLRGVKQRLLVSLLTVVIISACSRTAIEHSGIPASKPLLTSCRVVQQAMGEICVPDNPQRILTLFHQSVLGHVLVLEVKPIGSSVRSIEHLSGNYLNDQTYLGNKTEGIKQLGLEYQNDLEKILLLKPDLILAWDGVDRKTIYPVLSQIAPTVIVPGFSMPSWKERFKFIAEVLGKQAEAQQALNHYYQRIKELKTALGDRYQNQTISVAGGFGFNMVSFVKNSFIGYILDDLGLSRLKAQNVITPNGAIYNLSAETLEQVDGDVLFYLVFSKEARAAFESLQQKPLWKKLKAVQQGQVYLVDGHTWTGADLFAADLVIDDLYKYLVNTP